MPEIMTRVTKETTYFSKRKPLFPAATVIRRKETCNEPRHVLWPIQTFDVKHRLTGENKLFSYMRNS